MVIESLIDKKELRVGLVLNIFRPEVTGFLPVKIDEPRLIALITGEETTYYPVPLTSEILERGGFKKAEGDAVWDDCKLSDFETVYWISGMYFLENENSLRQEYYNFYYCTDEDTYCLLRTIKNLHELQNLYFALTGEEIEVNAT